MPLEISAGQENSADESPSKGTIEIRSTVPEKRRLRSSNSSKESTRESSDEITEEKEDNGQLEPRLRKRKKIIDLRRNPWNCTTKKGYAERKRAKQISEAGSSFTGKSGKKMKKKTSDELFDELLGQTQQQNQFLNPSEKASNINSVEYASRVVRGKIIEHPGKGNTMTEKGVYIKQKSKTQKSLTVSDKNNLEFDVVPNKMDIHPNDGNFKTNKGKRKYTKLQSELTTDTTTKRMRTRSDEIELPLDENESIHPIKGRPYIPELKSDQFYKKQYGIREFVILLKREDSSISNKFNSNLEVVNTAIVTTNSTPLLHTSDDENQSVPAVNVDLTGSTTNTSVEQSSSLLHIDSYQLLSPVNSKASDNSEEQLSDANADTSGKYSVSLLQNSETVEPYSDIKEDLNGSSEKFTDSNIDTVVEPDSPLLLQRLPDNELFDLSINKDSDIIEENLSGLNTNVSSEHSVTILHNIKTWQSPVNKENYDAAKDLTDSSVCTSENKSTSLLKQFENLNPDEQFDSDNKGFESSTEELSTNFNTNTHIEQSHLVYSEHSNTAEENVADTITNYSVSSSQQFETLDSDKQFGPVNNKNYDAAKDLMDSSVCTSENKSISLSQQFENLNPDEQFGSDNKGFESSTEELSTNFNTNTHIEQSYLIYNEHSNTAEEKVTDSYADTITKHSVSSSQQFETLGSDKQLGPVSKENYGDAEDLTYINVYSTSEKQSISLSQQFENLNPDNKCFESSTERFSNSNTAANIEYSSSITTDLQTLRTNLLSTGKKSDITEEKFTDLHVEYSISQSQQFECTVSDEHLVPPNKEDCGGAKELIGTRDEHSVSSHKLENLNYADQLNPVCEKNFDGLKSKHQSNPDTSTEHTPSLLDDVNGTNANAGINLEYPTPSSNKQVETSVTEIQLSSNSNGRKLVLAGPAFDKSSEYTVLTGFENEMSNAEEQIISPVNCDESKSLRGNHEGKLQIITRKKADYNDYDASDERCTNSESEMSSASIANDLRKSSDESSAVKPLNNFPGKQLEQVSLQVPNDTMHTTSDTKGITDVSEQKKTPTYHDTIKAYVVEISEGSEVDEQTQDKNNKKLSTKELIATIDKANSLSQKKSPSNILFNQKEISTGTYPDIRDVDSSWESQTKAPAESYKTNKIFKVPEKKGLQRKFNNVSETAKSEITLEKNYIVSEESAHGNNRTPNLLTPVELVTTYELNGYIATGKRCTAKKLDANTLKKVLDVATNSKSEVSLEIKVERKRVDHSDPDETQAAPSQIKSDKTVNRPKKATTLSIVPTCSEGNSAEVPKTGLSMPVTKEQKMLSFSNHTHPVRKYLKKFVPFLLEGLLKLTNDRPEDPIQYLADWMIKNKGLADKLIKDSSG